jgi:hypothetical protein
MRVRLQGRPESLFAAAEWPDDHEQASSRKEAVIPIASAADFSGEAFVQYATDLALDRTFEGRRQKSKLGGDMQFFRRQ